MTKVKVQNRDALIIQEYGEGRNLNEMSREHGVTVRRIKQILEGQQVPRRTVVKKEGPKPISAVHARIGRLLFDKRFDRGEDMHEAGNRIGWSYIKISKAERGCTELELLELLDIVVYLGMPIGELIKNVG